MDPNPSAAKVATRKISHDLRDLNSLRAGAMTGGRRLQRQVIRAPEPAKIGVQSPFDRRTAHDLMVGSNDKKKLLPRADPDDLVPEPQLLVSGRDDR